MRLRANNPDNAPRGRPVRVIRMGRP